QRRLPHPGHVLDEEVAPREKPDDRETHDVGLPDERAVEVRFQAANEVERSGHRHPYYTQRRNRPRPERSSAGSELTNRPETCRVPNGSRGLNQRRSGSAKPWHGACWAEGSTSRVHGPCGGRGGGHVPSTRRVPP